jgi:ribosomal protein S18 acetylase RimI-like enzyme
MKIAHNKKSLHILDKFTYNLMKGGSSNLELSVVKGTLQYLEACAEALFDSEIGAVYFSPKERALAFLRDGLTNGEIYVALDANGDCLGYIWFTLDGAFSRFPYVRNIAIKKEHRGKGIGKQLLSFFEEKGFNTTTRVFLLVSNFNTKAQKFYRKMGYQEVGRIPDLVRQGVTEHIMMKRKKEQ